MLVDNQTLYCTAIDPSDPLATLEIVPINDDMIHSEPLLKVELSQVPIESYLRPEAFNISEEERFTLPPVSEAI